MDNLFGGKLFAIGYGTRKRAALRRQCRAGAGFATWRRPRENKDVAQAITSDPDIMHGTPVFRGMRTAQCGPFSVITWGQEGAGTHHLEGFPTVSRALAVEALEEAKQLLLARA